MTVLSRVAWMAIALLLAGCAESPAPAPAPDSHATMDHGLATGQVLRPANLTLGTPSTQSWLNGSLAAQDYSLCLAVTCTEGGKHFEVTPLLVQGAWARLNLTLTWSDTVEAATWDALEGHILALWFDPGSDPVVYWDETHGPGKMAYQIVLHHTGTEPVVASVLRSFQGAGAATDFALRIEVSSPPLSHYSPLALQADASATELVVYASATSGVLRVWDGDDGFVGTFPLQAPSLRVDLRNLTRGAPVVQVVSDTPVRFEVAQDIAAPAPTLRPLALERRFSAPRDIPDQGVLDWEFEVDSPPLWIGLYLQAKDHQPNNGCLSMATPGACYATLMGAGSLRSPAGDLVDFTWNCFFCGGHVRFSSEADDKALVSGTYAVHYESKASANFQVGDYAAWYVR